MIGIHFLGKKINLKSEDKIYTCVTYCLPFHKKFFIPSNVVEFQDYIVLFLLLRNTTMQVKLFNNTCAYFNIIISTTNDETIAYRSDKKPTPKQLAQEQHIDRLSVCVGKAHLSSTQSLPNHIDSLEDCLIYYTY